MICSIHDKEVMGSYPIGSNSGSEVLSAQVGYELKNIAKMYIVMICSIHDKEVMGSYPIGSNSGSEVCQHKLDMN